MEILADDEGIMADSLIRFMEAAFADETNGIVRALRKEKHHAHVIAYDIGTTGVKTGLISVGETVELVADAYQGYDLYILENGGAEQDARPVVELPCAKRPGA